MTSLTKVTDSSLVKGIDYDSKTRKLRVKLSTRRNTYTFKQVPKALYEKFAESDSKGQFFNRHIRGIYDVAA